MKIILGLMILALISTQLGEYRMMIFWARRKVEKYSRNGNIGSSYIFSYLRCFVRCYFYTFVCETIVTRDLDVG